MPPLEFSHPQPVDQAAAQHLSQVTPDCSFAREVQTQVSASIAQPMPGAESIMAGPGMGTPLVPGAEQTISPLIQMIMRMPGHIGLASSFFECLGNFFLPQTDMLNLFDPTHFGLHIDLSSVLPGDHSSIDFSLLPHDAPLLDHLGNADLSSAHSLDLASDKLNISLGGHASHFGVDGGSTSLSMGSQFNVSGPAAFGRPQFEGAGGLVSGPSVSENFSADSLASNNRLFSDGAGISSASKNMMMAGGGTQPTTLATPSLAQGASSGALASSANPGLNTLASSGVNTAGASGNGMIDNVSAQASPANNVSYNVFEKLAGNKDILAANSVSDSYHSTIGEIKPDAPSDTVTQSTSSHGSATTGSANPGGLKAKPMSLDGSKVELKADHAKLDNTKIDHPKVEQAQHSASLEHKAEHKLEPKAEAKPEAKMETADHPAGSVHKTEHIDQTATTAHKVDHSQHASGTEHKVEHVQHTASAEHKAEHAQHTATTAHKVEKAEGSQISDATTANKTVDQSNHQTVKPVSHTAAHAAVPAHQPNHTQTANASPADPGHSQVRHVDPEGKHLAAADAPANPAAQGQNDAAQSAASFDAQKQFGDPVKSQPAGDATATGGDSSAHAGDTANTGNTGDATQGQDSGSQLEKAQASVTAKPYTIRSGDCLWNIAKDQLGDATKWSDIYKLNSDVLGSNPSLIHPGVSLQMPGADGAGAGAGSIAHYTVKPGDNLWDIAKNQMGDATKWGDLYKANQDIIGSNPDLIRPGQELTINTGAADPSGAQVTSMNAGPDPAQVSAHAQAPTGAAPMQHAGGEGTVSQTPPQGIQTYGDTPAAGAGPDMQAPAVQHSSDINFDPAPVNHDIQAPQAPSVAPAKVMPVPAQPDAIIPPAHAADLTSPGAISPEAANVAHSLAQGQKSGLVNTNMTSDLMSFINKRR
jgi:nucleoid-associated protein YgaU